MADVLVLDDDGELDGFAGSEAEGHGAKRRDQLGVHKKDLQQLYASFKPARVDAGGNPVVEDLKPPDPKGDTPEIDKALKGSY